MQWIYTCKRRSVLNIHWKDWCWSWNSNTLANWCEELSHWKRLWCWEGLGAGGEGDDRGWDGWMASLTRWTWVWANSGRHWRTGKPGVLQFMGWQRVGHDWATELNWTDKIKIENSSRRFPRAALLSQDSSFLHISQPEATSFVTSTTADQCYCHWSSCTLCCYVCNFWVSPSFAYSPWGHGHDSVTFTFLSSLLVMSVRFIHVVYGEVVHFFHCCVLCSYSE